MIRNSKQKRESDRRSKPRAGEYRKDLGGYYFCTIPSIDGGRGYHLIVPSKRR